MKCRFQLGLIVILALFVASLLLSLKATPDMQPFFALKRVQENLFLEFKSDPEKKVDYMSNILNSRLEELQSVVKNENYDHVLKASLRYSTLAGRITEIVVDNNLTDKIDRVKDQFLSHQKLLDALYVAYPKNIPDNEEHKYIQDDYNYLNLYLDQLEKVK
ncbi:hypothetical protein KKE78_03030 [Patescibacteria group bacterium]|nr:hypothetical protein [Patescibacteria group bacterium]